MLVIVVRKFDIVVDLSSPRSKLLKSDWMKQALFLVLSNRFNEENISYQGQKSFKQAISRLTGLVLSTCNRNTNFEYVSLYFRDLGGKFAYLSRVGGPASGP